MEIYQAFISKRRLSLSHFIGAPKPCFLLLIIGCLFLFSPYVSAYDLEIDDINIDMKVNEDNTYDIKETINVTFNSSYMHGIFRDIPLETYYGKPVKITNIQVQNHPFVKESINGQLRLKIGDANSYAASKEVYTISYTYEIGDDRNQTMDELYFNLIGMSWEIPIKHTNFRIQMPKAFDEKNLNFTSGIMGSTGLEELIFMINNNVISGSLDKVLNPGEALTIALPLPEGYYGQVKQDWFLMEAIKPLIPFIIVIIFVLGLFIFVKYGKDEPLVPTIEFYPPDNMSPIEAGYILDRQVDPYDLTSMLVYWADKGYIKFREVEVEKGLIFKRTESTIEIEQLKTLPTNLPDYEYKYFNDLFDLYASDNIVSIKSLENRFYVTLATVKQLLIRSYKTSASKKLITKESKKAAFFIGFLSFVIFTVVARSVFHEISPYQRFLSNVFAVMIGFISMVFGISGSKLYSKVSSRLSRDKFGYGIMGTLNVGISIGIYSFLTLFIIKSPMYTVLALFGWVLALLVPFSQRFTDTGRSWMNHLTGLKAFIQNAEKDRIEELVHQDPEYYYHILAYAMALGVTDAWASRFESITLEQPSWYESSYRYGAFNAVVFTNRLSTYTETIGNSMASTPSSSGGSSGGGSSGGGSGGGGGGGW